MQKCLNDNDILMYSTHNKVSNLQLKSLNKKQLMIVTATDRHG